MKTSLIHKQLWHFILNWSAPPNFRVSKMSSNNSALAHILHFNPSLRMSRSTKRVPSLAFSGADEVSSQGFPFVASFHFFFIRSLDFFRLKYTALLTFLFFHRNILLFEMQLIFLSNVKITELNSRFLEVKNARSLLLAVVAQQPNAEVAEVNTRERLKGTVKKAMPKVSQHCRYFWDRN